MNKAVSTFFLFAALALSVPADIHENAGIARYDFLDIGAGAQPMAMAGAYAGASGDIYSLYWNPAGIAGMPRPVFMADYFHYAMGIQRGMVGAVLDSSFCRGWGTLGFAINYLNAGIFETVDEFGNHIPGNDFSAGYNVFSATFARSLPEYRGYLFSAGVTFKQLLENIADYSSYGSALDFGAHCVFPSKGLKIGLSVRNLGTVFSEDSSRLPQTYTLGIIYNSKSWPNSRFAFDVVKPRYGVYEARLGLDYRVNRDLNIRLGYRFLEDEVRYWYHKIRGDSDNYVREDFNFFSAGIGLKLSRKMVCDLALNINDYQTLPFISTSLLYTLW